MKAKKFDKKFFAGDSVVQYLDLEHAFQPGQEQRRVNVDFPSWMVSRLDQEAKRLGVPRQSLIKIWIAENCRACNCASVIKLRCRAAHRYASDTAAITADCKLPGPSVR